MNGLTSQQLKRFHELSLQANNEQLYAMIIKLQTNYVDRMVKDGKV